MLGGAFELKALGPQTLKGFEAPVPAWAVLREAEIVSRFEASRAQGDTPFVGRDHELALIRERWRDAREGEGQVVLLSGEAGIGKSRILAALRERIGGEPHVPMRYQCSPHHVNDAFYPITAAPSVAAVPSGARGKGDEHWRAVLRLLAEAERVAPRTPVRWMREQWPEHVSDATMRRWVKKARERAANEGEDHT